MMWKAFLEWLFGANPKPVSERLRRIIESDHDPEKEPWTFWAWRHFQVARFRMLDFGRAEL